MWHSYMLWNEFVTKMGVCFFMPWNIIHWIHGALEGSLVAYGWSKFYERSNIKTFQRIHHRGDYWGTSSWDDGYVGSQYIISPWVPNVFLDEDSFSKYSQSNSGMYDSDEVHSQLVNFS